MRYFGTINQNKGGIFSFEANQFFSSKKDWDKKEKINFVFIL